VSSDCVLHQFRSHKTQEYFHFRNKQATIQPTIIMPSSRITNAFTSKRTLMLTLFVVLCISSTTSVVNAKLYRYEPTGEVSYIEKKALLEKQQSAGPAMCPSCAPSQHQPPQGLYTFLAIFASALATLDTILRSFAFGFGVRLIKFVVVEKDETLEKLKERIWKSAVVGLAFAGIVLGLGLVIPAARFQSY
jgi:hypothetical protein